MRTLTDAGVKTRPRRILLPRWLCYGQTLYKQTGCLPLRPRHLQRTATRLQCAAGSAQHHTWPRAARSSCPWQAHTETPAPPQADLLMLPHISISPRHCAGSPVDPPHFRANCCLSSTCTQLQVIAADDPVSLHTTQAWAGGVLVGRRQPGHTRPKFLLQPPATLCQATLHQQPYCACRCLLCQYRACSAASICRTPATASRPHSSCT